MIYTSALLTNSASVHIGKCVLRGVMCTDNNATTVTIANSLTDATLPKAFCMSVTGTTTFAWFGEKGLSCSLGIYVTFSAAAGQCIVYYEIK